MYDSKYLIFNNQYCVVIMMWIRHVNFNTNLCVCFLVSPRSLTAPRFCTDSDSYDGMGLALQYHCLSLLPNFPRKPYLKTNNKVSQTLSINRNNVHIKNRIFPSIMGFYYLSEIDSFFI